MLLYLLQINFQEDLVLLLDLSSKPAGLLGKKMVGRHFYIIHILSNKNSIINGTRRFTNVNAATIVVTPELVEIYLLSKLDPHW